LNESGNKTGIAFAFSFGGATCPRNFFRMLSVARREFAYILAMAKWIAMKMRAFPLKSQKIIDTIVEMQVSVPLLIV